jgi:hypothetical protein
MAGIRAREGRINPMTAFSRRAFLGALAASIPSAWLVRHAHAASVDELTTDARTMRALGDAVLPSSLGRGGASRAVDAFQQWISGYRANAELVHPYATSALEYSGPTPAIRWAAQLAALDTLSHRAHGRRFAELDAERRRAIVQGELDLLKADRLTSIARAPHVAIALLAHFYASPAATDLCYDAAIARQSCRPLATSPRKPLPLAPHTGRQ